MYSCSTHTAAAVARTPQPLIDEPLSLHAFPTICPLSFNPLFLLFPQVKDGKTCFLAKADGDLSAQSVDHPQCPTTNAERPCTLLKNSHGAKCAASLVRKNATTMIPPKFDFEKEIMVRPEDKPRKAKKQDEYIIETTQNIEEYNKEFGDSTGGNWCACYDSTGKKSAFPASKCQQLTHVAKYFVSLKNCKVADRKVCVANAQADSKE